MTGLPPHATAAVDQIGAQLRDLVQMVRDHRDGCLCPPPCIGLKVGRELARLPCLDRASLLGIALGELAALGYGLPTAADTYHPTDAAPPASTHDERPST